MNVLSLFDGMSCGMVALERAEIRVSEYYASEINPHAIKISQKNYPQIVQIGPVQSVSFSNEFEGLDLLIGGSPCQSFSIGGDATGFGGKSGIINEFFRIKREPL